jgi:hypothetical protein
VDIFLENKWRKLLSRARLFRFIPFADFVLVAGSMAMGNPKEDSDFDVIVGVRQGRIFTARFFCILFFGLLGWRQKGDHLADKRLQEPDRFCFNHFITPSAYRLSPPHNKYWKDLYKSLVPIYGDPAVTQKFYDANADWMGERRIYKNDSRHLYEYQSLIKSFLERLLSGKSGDLLEKLKFIQIYFIKCKLKNLGYKPRIIFNDSELEFHPDTKRIEEYNALTP